jgi:hypothetical protein
MRLGWYLQEKGLFSDPSRIWGAFTSPPGQVEGIENSGRISKQILVLHEELVLKSGTVQNCKILLTGIYQHLQGAQYVTLDNKIKCLSLAISFLATSPIKL